ncbi:hypothetical protein LPJ53_005215 [Coemansia erecta]|uniref:FAD-binding FR-type domain-containing protein n=1 Tax=Coemansia erecta TaxID=147472 RepID=A0A9W8CQS6_9FUNG|nr:hypothetical protein LPJ53_005215 [Coemansia erecta]
MYRLGRGIQTALGAGPTANAPRKALFSLHAARRSQGIPAAKAAATSATANSETTKPPAPQPTPEPSQEPEPKPGAKERPPGTYMIWAMEVIGGTAALLYYLHLHTDVLKPAVDSRLSPTAYTAHKLLSVTPLTGDTSLFRFEIKRPRFDGAEPETLVDAVRAQGVWAVDVKDHLVQTYRTYTPVEYHMDEEVDELTGARTGHVDLAVKRYPRGSLSRFIHGTRVGDSVEMRGPVLSWPYREGAHGRVYMVAGGTGVAPMVQLIERVLGDPRDRTSLSLLYGSPAEEDIIMRGRLDELVEKYPGRLSVEYLVERGAGGRGVRVGVPGRSEVARLVEGFDRAKGDVVLVCGPDAMMREVCGVRPVGSAGQGPLQGVLRDLGFAPASVFKF